MSSFFNFTFKKALVGAIVLLATIFFFIYQIPNFQLDASSDSLILEGDSSLIYYKKIKKNYKSNDYLIISYQVEGDLFSPYQLNHLRSFVKELKSIEQIKSITTVLNVPLTKSPPLSLIELGLKSITIDNNNADLSLVANEFTTSPLYVNNLVSNDGKTTAILIKLKNNKQFEELKAQRDSLRLKKTNNELAKDEASKLKIIEKQVLKNNSIANKLQAETVAKIRNIIDKHKGGAELFLGGVPMIVVDIIDYINNDLIIFSLVIIACMSIILLFIFRAIRWVLIPISISVSSALIMTGLLAFLDWKVTIISANFFSLLMVMTLSIVVHLIVRYRELAQQNPELELSQLVINTLEQMFKPCLFTAITTFIAFSSLIVSGIRPVIDFGWMMSIGITVAFVLSFLAFPIIVMLLPKAKIIKHKTELSISYALAKLTQRFGNQLLGIVLVLVLLAGFFVTNLSVENRFIDYFKKNTDISKGITVIDEKLGGTIPLEIIFEGLAEEYWNDEDLRADIGKIHRHLESFEETGKVLSVDTLLQTLTSINNDTELNGFFLNIVRKLIPDSVQKQVLNPYLSLENDQLRMVVRIKETNKNLKRNDFINNIENYLIQDMGFKKDSFHMTGMLILYNNMLQSLFDSQIKTIFVVFLMVFLMFIVIFKSFSLSIIAIITNALPPLFVLGAMGLLNISLDLMTITIAAIAIGIGVDNAIHYIHRFKIEFNKDADYLAAMYRSHSSIGLAIFYTSITVTLGFLILSLSNFIPSIYFGVFTAIAMLCALLANLTLLPKLILLVKPKIKNVNNI